MRRLIYLALAGILGFGAYGAFTLAQQPQMLNSNRTADVTVLMQAKLSSSQKVVEGLMAGDFAMIRKGGEQLGKICESTQWQNSHDQVVGHYRSELQRASMKLIAMAKDENLDGAAYTYMHTLTTCVNCHSYSRNVKRVAQAKQPSPVVSIPVTEREHAELHMREIYR